MAPACAANTSRKGRQLSSAAAAAAGRSHAPHDWAECYPTPAAHVHKDGRCCCCCWWCFSSPCQSPAQSSPAATSSHDSTRLLGNMQPWIACEAKPSGPCGLADHKGVNTDGLNGVGTRLALWHNITKQAVAATAAAVHMSNVEAAAAVARVGSGVTRAQQLRAWRPRSVHWLPRSCCSAHIFWHGWIPGERHASHVVGDCSSGW